MFGVGDHVTWACSGEGVGVGEVGVVQGLSADGFEAALAFQQGAFCLELCDLLKAGAAPPRRVPGCKSPRSSAGPAPRRPARAFEEGDYGGSAASSRRLTFGGRDGDEDDGGTDRGHGSNDDGAWGTDGATPSGGRVSGAGAGAAVRWGPIGVGDVCSFCNRVRARLFSRPRRAPSSCARPRLLSPFAAPPSRWCCRRRLRSRA